MNKLNLFAVLSIAITTFTSHAEEIRLVVSGHTQSMATGNASVTIQSSTLRCTNTIDTGKVICIDMKDVKRSSEISYSKVTIDDNGAGIEDVINTLNGTGWFNSVEEDVLIKSSSLTLNDPTYSYQTYLRSNNSLINNPYASVGHDFEGAWELLEGKSTKADVLVIDSAFMGETEDMMFVSGYSFATVFNNNPGPDYTPASESDCHNPHGLAVSSTIGAISNNTIAMSGATNNHANISVARVMDCGTGYLSDTANAVLFSGNQALDAETFPDLPTRDKPFDVVNLSLGGASSVCPSYMQYAINKAVEAGVIIIIAAGNNNTPSAGFSPANCDNVITVGALQSSGERATFSNYGESNDISAQGVDIIGLTSTTNQIGWWEGTSFSSPLVAAAVALAKVAAPSVPSDIIKLLTMFSGDKFSDNAVECETLGCGKSQLNAKNLVIAALKAENGEMGTIRHALSGEDECQQAWYVEHFGASAKLCSLYEIDFLGGVSSTDNTFVMYQTAKGTEFNAENDVFLTTQLGNEFVEDIDPEKYDYAFKICGNKGDDLICEDTLITLDASNAEISKKPVACN